MTESVTLKLLNVVDKSAHHNFRRSPTINFKVAKTKVYENSFTCRVVKLLRDVSDEVFAHSRFSPLSTFQASVVNFFLMQ